MGIARNIARLIPNGSGLLPNANIEALAASKLTGQVPDANAPSGSVIQVVSATKTDVFSLASLTFTDVTGLVLSITPISASSKILVMASVSIGSSGDFAYTRLTKNSNPINVGDAASNRPRVAGSVVYTASNGAYNCETIQMTHLDSPATTSTLTYAAQIRSGSSPFTIYVNRTDADRDTAHYEPRLASSITLMEIAA